VLFVTFTIDTIRAIIHRPAAKRGEYGGLQCKAAGCVGGLNSGAV